jgi:hypothetical protein
MGHASAKISYYYSGRSDGSTQIPAVIRIVFADSHDLAYEYSKSTLHSI